MHPAHPIFPKEILDQILVFCIADHEDQWTQAHRRDDDDLINHQADQPMSWALEIGGQDGLMDLLQGVRASAKLQEGFATPRRPVQCANYAGITFLSIDWDSVAAENVALAEQAFRHFKLRGLTIRAHDFNVIEALEYFTDWGQCTSLQELRILAGDSISSLKEAYEAVLDSFAGEDSFLDCIRQFSQLATLRIVYPGGLLSSEQLRAFVEEQLRAFPSDEEGSDRDWPSFTSDWNAVEVNWITEELASPSLTKIYLAYGFDDYLIETIMPTNPWYIGQKEWWTKEQSEWVCGFSDFDDAGPPPFPDAIAEGNTLPYNDTLRMVQRAGAFDSNVPGRREVKGNKMADAEAKRRRKGNRAQRNPIPICASMTKKMYGREVEELVACDAPVWRA
ncbi:hypothetical protein CYLTODRAFT_460009 [Cylindrobasidium torrendii FP15055 ss-10]|uniref:Uncharacterized protein n=1 Tax=Cylindrobasidium torrendii FP15055 ss-10 TaxID=1314674 RepID=A0A0D7ATU5_9AGAR|nr:hypothetical protein CYLTODRAFT_460009 [Cylindrobasidium torrendii FP15055 ss-10]